MRDAGTPDSIVLTPAKPWWQSRTLWFNALVAVGAALEAGTGLLAQLFTPEIYPRVALAVALINAVLRVVTTQAVTTK